MVREDRLREARETLIANYEAVWGRREVPHTKVQLDLLLVDLIETILGMDDDNNRDTLLNQSRFVRTEPDELPVEDVQKMALERAKEILKDYAPHVINPEAENENRGSGDFSGWLKENRDDSGPDKTRGASDRPRRVRRNSKSTSSGRA